MNLVEKLRDKGLAFSMFDRDIAADRIEALEAALKEAIEWDWMSDTHDLPKYVIEQVEAALNKGKNQ